MARYYDYNEQQVCITIEIEKYHNTQEDAAKILKTGRQSPKYAVPGTKTWDKTIAPRPAPDWAIPIAADRFCQM